MSLTAYKHCQGTRAMKKQTTDVIHEIGALRGRVAPLSIDLRGYSASHRIRVDPATRQRQRMGTPPKPEPVVDHGAAQDSFLADSENLSDNVSDTL